MEDQRGAIASESLFVNVLEDTLLVNAISHPSPGSFVMGGRETIQLDAEIVGCDFSGGGGNVGRWLVFSWRADTGEVFSERSPRFTFSTSASGSDHSIFLSVRNEATGTTRMDTLSFFVVPPPSLWLILVVDMPHGVPVSPSGIHVVGNFNNWDYSHSPLTNIEGTNQWSAVIEVPRNSNQFFRFVNGSGPSGNEIIPSTCSFGINNRFVNIDDVDVQYYTVFGECPSLD